MYDTSLIEAEAESLYTDYVSFKPIAENGDTVPAWKDNTREAVKDAWRVSAKGSLKRRAEALIAMQGGSGGGVTTSSLPDHGPPDPGKTGG